MTKPWDNKATSKVLAVLDEVKSTRNITQIRVVQWFGTKGSWIMVEKRDIYFDVDGNQRPGKCRGFTSRDYQLIVAEREKILPLLMGKTGKV